MVCTVERDRRPGGVQMITFTEKLTNLKYELLMDYFDRDIQFLSSLLIECRNMIIHEIFISNVKIIIRFVRKYVSKIEIRFIDIIQTTLDTTSAEVQQCRVEYISSIIYGNSSFINSFDFILQESNKLLKITFQKIYYKWR